MSLSCRSFLVMRTLGKMERTSSHDDDQRTPSRDPRTRSLDDDQSLFSGIMKNSVVNEEVLGQLFEIQERIGKNKMNRELIMKTSTKRVPKCTKKSLVKQEILRQLDEIEERIDKRRRELFQLLIERKVCNSRKHHECDTNRFHFRPMKLWFPMTERKSGFRHHLFQSATRYECNY